MAKASWDMIPFARWIGGAAVLAAMLLGLGSAADAKDCTRATPLPIDTTITAPADDVPADLAQFSGTWGGVWTTGPGDVGPCGTLVVEEIFPNGFVRVISSIGTHPPPRSATTLLACRGAHRRRRAALRASRSHAAAVHVSVRRRRPGRHLQGRLIRSYPDGDADR